LFLALSILLIGIGKSQRELEKLNDEDEQNHAGEPILEIVNTV